MSSSKEPVAATIIDPSKLAMRLLRELMNERANIKREPDLIKRREKFYELGSRLEFTLRILPELGRYIDVEWNLVNSGIEEVEKEMAELRDDPGEGWKFQEE